MLYNSCNTSSKQNCTLSACVALSSVAGGLGVVPVAAGTGAVFDVLKGADDDAVAAVACADVVEAVALVDGVVGVVAFAEGVDVLEGVDELEGACSPCMLCLGNSTTSSSLSLGWGVRSREGALLLRLKDDAIAAKCLLGEGGGSCSLISLKACS